jgi:hypothetical protein
MVCKIIDCNGIAMNMCTHANEEAVFQFYNVNNSAYSPYVAGDDPLGHWIQFQTGNYQIRHAGFYSSQFRLRRDRYAGLLSAFHATP